MATLRGAAFIAFVALTATLLLTLVLNRYAFPEQDITPARVALYGAVGLAFALGLVLPWLRINRRRSIERAEGKFPLLEQRLLTFSERQQTGDPFVELLAGDTLAKVQEAPASQLVPTGMLASPRSSPLSFLPARSSGWPPPRQASWAMARRCFGPDRRRSSPRCTTSTSPRATRPCAATATRRSPRSSSGWTPARSPACARWTPQPAWEAVDMQPQANGQGFGFTLAALPESVEYFVEAGPVHSKHYTVRVVDLPAVKDVKVTYHYPRWTGLPQVSEEHGGDLRALEGTDAELSVTMDSPLRDGMLLLDNGQPLHLTGGEGNHYHGTIRMQKDGAYHVAATDSGQQVRLSEDYFISTEKANPPQVAIDRPGADYRASPIEEVTLGVKAGADFGLHSVQLHYSVNGGPTQIVDVLKQVGAKNSNGSTTVNLENFKVVPGDVVSLYATAKDAHEEAKTDISFIQVDPFEREFSQSQQGGGGGGGGGQGAGNQTDISRREKELIAATWKQQNDKASTSSHSADMGKTLSEAQATLRQQVLALSARMESRDLSSANEEFTGFEKDMQAAAAAMVPSADKLKQQAWSDAMPNEQKALQALLRAEATFRKIQVAFGQQSGGGGGGGGSAGRDLASLFDLEMDTEKNQYETAQTGSPAEEQAKKVDDALAKLDALAKRQEELAQQQSQQAQNFQQRWQQEMLRREAEQLQREMEQMQAQQHGQQGQSASGQQSSSGQSSGQSGSSSQQGQSQQARSQSVSQSGSESKDGGADPRVQQALNRLREANEQMRRAAAPGQSGQSGAEQAREAAERLRQATNLMGGAQKQQATGKLDSLANDAGKLQAEEASEAERLRSLAASSTDSTRAAANAQERNRLVRDRQQLSDDVSHLQRSMRDTARQLATTQPAASSKLREALSGMDESDLGNRVQRTADGLRRGINPNSNGNEAAIASGLKQLDEGLKQAQSGMGSAPGTPDARKQGRGTEVAALDQLERLRSTVQSLSPGTGQPGSRGAQPGTQPGQSGQAQGNESRQGRPPGVSGKESGQAGSQSSQPGSPARPVRAGKRVAARRPAARRVGGGTRQSSTGGDSSPGDSNSGGNRVRTGGGGGAATWNVNTGNNTVNRNARRAAARRRS